MVDGVSSLLASLGDGDGRDPAGGGPASPADAAPDVVSDDDRHRYGVLLDRAAERGLLDPYDYEMRLGELASATSIDEMNRIVSELPAFTATPAARGPRRKTSSPASNELGGASGTRKRPANSWLLLIIVVVVVVASLAFLVVYTQHLTHTRNSGLGRTAAPTRPVSALRL